MTDKDFLSLYEFSDCLGIHYNTTRKMIRTGRITAIRIGIGGKGSSYRIPTSELQRLAEIDLGEIIEEIVMKRLINTKEKHKRLFFNKIEKTQDCWIWKGAKNKSGYGSFRHEGKHWMRANRVSYLLHKGDIPEGMLVCHSCDNPECVNPDHLHLGTPKSNMIERTERGR